MADGDKQANRRARMTTIKEQTSLRAIAASTQGEKKKEKRAGLMLVSYGGTRKQHPWMQEGKQIVVKTEFQNYMRFAT